MKKDRTCKHCNKIFNNIEGRIFSNHVRWCDKNPDRNKSNYKIKNSLLKHSEKKYGKIIKFNVNCYKCNIKFDVYEHENKHPLKEKYFCSKSCANSRNHSNETKKKISKSISNLWKDDNYAKNIIEKNIKNNKIFTSKNEKYIKEYLINNYPEDNWTSGGHLKYKGESLTRDIYSKKLKINIEYDGIWHFKDIKGQLKHKKYKDSLLKDWSLKNNYRLIRISEAFYKKNINCINIIINAIYNKTEPYLEYY